MVARAGRFGPGGVYLPQSSPLLWGKFTPPYFKSEVLMSVMYSKQFGSLPRRHRFSRFKVIWRTVCAYIHIYIYIYIYMYTYLCLHIHISLNEIYNEAMDPLQGRSYPKYYLTLMCSFARVAWRTIRWVKARYRYRYIYIYIHRYRSRYNPSMSLLMCCTLLGGIHAPWRNYKRICLWWGHLQAEKTLLIIRKHY